MAALALMGSLGSLGVVGGSAAAVAVNTLYVSTTGSDAPNTCSTPATPCATINYAISVAVAGETIKVASGTYLQTVAVTKPIRLIGAGPTRSIINGTGIDPFPLYGVVYVGPTGGASSVSGFGITGAAEYAETGGEPEVVALADSNPSDSVVITHDIISLGVDPGSSTDFPIGIDSFNNTATTTISHNTVSGTFQGALLEDNGPVSFDHNKVKSLIANTVGVTPDVTTFVAEGLFFLSDLGTSLTGQNASNNTFSSYGGYGIIMEAGYNNGNCSITPCNGSIAGAILHNRLALQASSPAVGIDLQSRFNGNNLTATVSNNHGFVTSPDQGVVQQASNGATISVIGNGNRIRVKP
ncbi:MAG TPA: hypothetical protein VNC61_07355 [Acidimicrobiales bacterium]|nr:hypothetical protein [Acidimicrobiales bacterium]